MRRTLIEIPYEVSGVPLFGFGVLFFAWLVFAAIYVAILVRRQGWSRETTSNLPVLLLIGAAFYLLPKFFPGGMPVRGYGVMVLLGVIAAVGLAMRLAERMGLDPEIIISLAFWVFAAGIAGARLFHVIEYWDVAYYKPGDPMGTLRSIINIPSGGLVVYGSFIGGAIAFFWFMRAQRLPALAMADIVAPGVITGMIFGRIGCLLNGCCYGGLCDEPWAITFPAVAESTADGQVHFSPPYQDQLDRGYFYGMVLPSDPKADPVVLDILPDSGAAEAGLSPGDEIDSAGGKSIKTTGELQQVMNETARTAHELRLQTTDSREIVLPALRLTADDGQSSTLPAAPLPSRSLPVHPTQIYSSINAVLILLVLLAWYPFRQHDGEVFALFLTLYPITRFLLEAIRVDETSFLGTGFSISQNVSFAVLILAAGLWSYVLRQPPGSALPPADATGEVAPETRT